MQLHWIFPRRNKAASREAGSRKDSREGNWVYNPTPGGQRRIVPCAYGYRYGGRVMLRINTTNGARQHGKRQGQG